MSKDNIFNQLLGDPNFQYKKLYKDVKFLIRPRGQRCHVKIYRIAANPSYEFRVIPEVENAIGQIKKRVMIEGMPEYLQKLMIEYIYKIKPTPIPEPRELILVRMFEKRDHLRSKEMREKVVSFYRRFDYRLMFIHGLAPEFSIMKVRDVIEFVITNYPNAHINCDFTAKTFISEFPECSIDPKNLGRYLRNKRSK